MIRKSRAHETDVKGDYKWSNTGRKTYEGCSAGAVYQDEEEGAIFIAPFILSAFSFLALRYLAFVLGDFVYTDDRITSYNIIFL